MYMKLFINIKKPILLQTKYYDIKFEIGIIIKNKET